VGTPSAASFVASIIVISKGSKTGNARTGYRVPFELAFEIIAAIIVEAETIPKFPRITVTAKAKKLFILIPVIIENKKNITIFKENVSTKLNSNLPKNTSVAPADNFNASEVPVSSSLIKTLESPLIAVKNITIQKSPDNIVSSTFSSPRENLIIEIVIITNINNEFITYLFFISDLMSFLNTEYECLSNSN
jgi:hypothetical protein